ncbi:MAG: T9SS type A sorting domain-containing protein [Bacteroidales bacterium]|nr:T9SS type A sorting domain-containing protein [Bacteroidales bacterium]
MKKSILIILLLISFINSYPDRYITRGPNPGEIYFLGPTYTGEGLYYSTDFGMTAVCMDSTIYQAMRIAADKTPGVIYYATMSGAFYSSNNYGNTGSWQYVNSGIYLLINSGVTEGFIYNAINSHSEDFGNNFIPHSYNGFFGSLKDTEIDNQSNIGYAITRKSSVSDTLYLLMTIDNFENLSIHNKLNMGAGSVIKLSRSVNDGELFLFNRNEYKLYYSNDYCLNWINLNSFNQSFEFDDIVGGRDEGEIYILFRDINMMWQNANIYILYSNDYGITFEVFHPFKKGQEPLLANYSSKIENNSIYDNITNSNDSVYFPNGEIPLTVKFYNYSIGNIINYEWDFENDGIIDSYEESPIHTYVDTGYYSVKLTVNDDMDTNSFLRENYIYAYELTTINELLFDTQINCYPNPFKENTNINFSIPHKSNVIIKVYNILGKEVTSKYLGILDKGTHNTEFSAINLQTGIYYYSLLVNGETAGVRKMVKVE